MERGRNRHSMCLFLYHPREGRMIQKRIMKSRKPEPPNLAKIFAKLVMGGHINLALRYLSEEDCGGLLNTLVHRKPSQELWSLVLLRMSHVSYTVK